MNELVKLKQKYSSLKEIVVSQNLTNLLDIEEELSLHVLPSACSYDQTFIREAIKLSYATEQNVLSNLYLTNRKKHPGVHKMTNVIRLGIKNMFSRRLRKCELTELQFNARMENFRILLKNALFKIRDEYKN